MTFSKFSIFCLAAIYGISFNAYAEYDYENITIAARDARTFDGETKINNTTLRNYSVLTLTDQAYANNTVLNGSYGQLILSDNAHASNTKINENSTLLLKDFATADNIVMNHGSLTLEDSSSVDGLTVGRTHIKINLSDNASITNAILNKTLATITLNDSSSAIGTMLSHSSYIYGYDSASVDDSSVESGSAIYLHDYTKANNNTLNGSLIMQNFSSATNTTIIKGYLYLYDNATAENTLNSQGTIKVWDTASIDNTTVNGTGFLSFHNNSSGNDTTINDAGVAYLYDEASVTGTTVNDGYMALNDSAIADKTTINLSGTVDVLENAQVNGTTVNGNGYLNVKGTSLANETTINDNGTMVVYSHATANDTMINSGQTLLYTDALASGYTRINTYGELIMEAGSRATNVAINGGVLSITDLTDATISYDAARVDNLTMDRGSVSFLRDSDGDYAALSIGNLSGTGNFLFNISLAERNGNFVTIDSGTGDFSVIVFDSGREIADFDDLTVNLVNDVEGNINLSLMTAFGRSTDTIDGGVFMYSLYNQSGKDGLNGDVWYLGMPGTEPQEPGTEEPNTGTPDTEGPSTPNTEEPDTAKPEVVAPKTTPSTDAVLSMASASVSVVNAELDGLRAYRATLTPNAQDNVWGHYIGSNSRVDTSNGAAYRLEQTGLEIGKDFSTAFDGGMLVTGAYMFYSDNNVKHARGGKSSIDSYGLGAYATWFDNSGAYIDGVVKGNRLSSKLNATMTSGEYTTGNWNQYAISGALEAGYRFTPAKSTYIEPYLRSSAVQVNSANIALSNGMQANIGHQRSWVAETGARVGYQFNVGSSTVEPYLRAAVLQEMAQSNQVTINKHYKFNNNVNGTSGRYGAGANMTIADNVTMYGEVNYRQGRHIEEPVQGVVGFKVAL